MIYTLTLNPALDLEYSVDRIEMGAVHRAADFRSDWGGKGFNVSRVLKVLGESTTAVGFAGGPTGKRLEAGLRDLSIPTELVWVQGETRTNVSIVGGRPGEYVKVNHPGPNVSSEEVKAILDRITSLTKSGDLWVLSGSLPPGVAADFYAHAIRAAKAAGSRAVLDTSGAALRPGCLAKPFLIKPNAEEAAELVQLKVESVADAVQAAQLLTALGPENVVLSMGAEGGIAIEGGDTAWFAHPPLIKAANPVGAGDALVAGLVAGIQRGWRLDKSLQLGIACGTSAASQPGTGIGSCSEIMALFERVAVSSL